MNAMLTDVLMYTGYYFLGVFLVCFLFFVFAVSGSTFIIWGKKSCPFMNGTEEVYSGNSES